MTYLASGRFEYLLASDNLAPNGAGGTLCVVEGYRDAEYRHAKSRYESSHIQRCRGLGGGLYHRSNGEDQGQEYQRLLSPAIYTRLEE